tara:strand:- start:4783 stop:6150 length:1368 start_codon:yes stop_codon:yes gene_type:complete
MLKNVKDDPFAKSFRAKISSMKYLKKNDKVIIAVSGGMDSIALLYLAHCLNRFKIIVAHVDHSIREESIKDKIFVEGICKNFKIQFFFKKLNYESRSKNESLEEWARKKRYEYLKNLCDKTNSKWIMTGHHCNDHAETILINLSRQTGILGILGIQQKNGRIIRPLLSFNKKELYDFVMRLGLSFVEDSTNSDTSLPRNFIRNEVLKPWEVKVPSLIKSIYKTSKNIEEWKLLIDHILKGFIIDHLKISDRKIEIPTSSLNSLPNLGKLRLFQLLFQKEKKLWSRHDFKMLGQFLNKPATGKISTIITSWLLLHDRGLIIARKRNHLLLKKQIKITPNRSVYFNKKKYRINTEQNKCQITGSKNEEIVDWSKLKNRNLKIRLWKKGDVFQPLGMKNKKKLSDFLINQKINNFSKTYQSVLTVDGEIAWVCGLRISEWVRITRNTTERALLMYTPL